MNQEYLLFAGAFSKEENRGIQSFRYDAAGQFLTRIGVFGEYHNMSCMAIDGDLMIACVESADSDLLVSLRILPDGSLKKIGETHIGGCSIAHLCMDNRRRLLLASSMASSMVLLLRYDLDGGIEILDRVVFTDPGSCAIGYSANPRQGSARIHSAFFLPDGIHIHVCNLGSDKIYTLSLDGKTNKLSLCPALTFTTEGGEGPRHAVYGKDGKFVYINAEMGNRIYVFSIGADCALKLLQRVSTLDPDKENPPKGETSVSIMSGDGKYLFCGNRGQNNIARFEIGVDGLLAPAGHFDCYGTVPRGLAFGQGGGVIFCCNNASGTLAVIGYDKQTGTPGECLQIVDGVPGAANAVLAAFPSK